MAAASRISVNVLLRTMKNHFCYDEHRVCFSTTRGTLKCFLKKQKQTTLLERARDIQPLIVSEPSSLHLRTPDDLCFPNVRGISASHISHARTHRALRILSLSLSIPWDVPLPPAGCIVRKLTDVGNVGFLYFLSLKSLIVHAEGRFEHANWHFFMIFTTTLYAVLDFNVKQETK